MDSGKGVEPATAGLAHQGAWPGEQSRANSAPGQLAIPSAICCRRLAPTRDWLLPRSLAGAGAGLADCLTYEFADTGEVVRPRVGGGHVQSCRRRTPARLCSVLPDVAAAHLESQFRACVRCLCIATQACVPLFCPQVRFAGSSRLTGGATLPGIAGRTGPPPHPPAPAQCRYEPVTVAGWALVRLQACLCPALVLAANVSLLRGEKAVQEGEAPCAACSRWGRGSGGGCGAVRVGGGGGGGTSPSRGRPATSTNAPCERPHAQALHNFVPRPLSHCRRGLLIGPQGVQQFQATVNSQLLCGYVGCQYTYTRRDGLAKANCMQEHALPSNLCRMHVSGAWGGFSCRGSLLRAALGVCRKVKLLYTHSLTCPNGGGAGLWPSLRADAPLPPALQCMPPPSGVAPTPLLAGCALAGPRCTPTPCYSGTRSGRSTACRPPARPRRWWQHAASPAGSSRCTPSCGSSGTTTPTWTASHPAPVSPAAHTQHRA